MAIKSIGFPRMHKEESERRDFLPEIFKKIQEYKDTEICLENGYGEAMGFKEEDYLKAHPKIKFQQHQEVYKKDMVIVLRAPIEEEIRLMKKGSVLFSMLHYETRELRNQLLRELGIKGISMDGLVDDKNKRMLVNFRGTSRSGVRIAIEELKKKMPDFYGGKRKPICASLIGFGDVGIYAAKALGEFSNIEFSNEKRKASGIITKVLPSSVTKDMGVMEKILEKTDILVDASRRKDASQIIVPNKLVGKLPEHAVILDLSADPYNDKIKPMQVKGIEGIPTGTLDKYIIHPDDKLYDTIPKTINTENRRLVISCNAWPGVDPIECMKIYGEQIYDFLSVLLEKEIGSLKVNSKNLYERALVRATLDYFYR
ncbi:alanine dehydrogenase [Natronincola peptidivorans]|uniref:Alanine dehydrogenase n=1 Tax=Natronincola peptidivorans TaxID=426128 RepID=A0A1I0A610_9FIRM|nr:alanine dehydrogenase [Natronincola peptidivorans]SES89608.1 alanine dehydrogenase [Natronincola peptidivorans]